MGWKGWSCEDLAAHSQAWMGSLALWGHQERYLGTGLIMQYEAFQVIHLLKNWVLPL